MNPFNHRGSDSSATDTSIARADGEGGGAGPALSMAARQGATPPTWLGQPSLRLLRQALGGWRQNRDKLVHLALLLYGYGRPALVRRRLRRLVELGHADVVPTVAQLLVAGRDQMIVSASAETRLFYRSQGIPWIFHNLRRFLSGPATMLDPVGLFAPRDAIVHHVLQTFHRHPVYDLVLLRAHPGGLDEMARQARQIGERAHPHQVPLTSLIEDGSYHARLPGEIQSFVKNPHLPARPIPTALIGDADLMLAMDQFKDVRGLVRYAARLRVGWGGALLAWLAAAFDESVGPWLGIRLGPRRVNISACDPDLVARHQPRGL